MKHLTGLPINYLVTVNFLGFIQIVDRVGGVWVDVDRRYYNKNVGTESTNFSNIDLRPGYQLLKGRDALSYVRYRHTDSDLYRLARQQQFVKALKEQVSSNFSVFKALKVVGAITHNVEIGQAGGGSLENTIRRYALFAYGLPSGHFFQSKIGDLQGTNELSRRRSAIQAAVQDFQTPDVEAPRNAAAVSFGRKAAGVEVAAAEPHLDQHPQRQRRHGLGVDRLVRAVAARLPDRVPRRLRGHERAELQVLPHDGLLRPAAEGLEARGAQGRRPLRRRGRREATRGGAREGAARDAHRRRRLDVPRDARAGAGGQDAEEAAGPRPQRSRRRRSRCSGACAEKSISG